MKLNAKYLLPFLAVLVSCAGPMNPFGSITPETDATAHDSIRGPASYITQTDATIDFSPTRQNWNEKVDFKTRIVDENGIGPMAKIRFFYNNQDITNQVKDKAYITKSNDHNILIYEVKDFRLNLDEENQISVSYQRDDHSAPIIKHYEKPSCPTRSVQKVLDQGRFKSKFTTFSTIEEVSLEKNFNPSLLAGLIAQESGFNSRAISWAKAIGLTQVTSLAEQHVIEKHPDWPRYQNLSSYSYPQLKALIFMGKINSKNEWRLNKKMSIKGGIEYFRFVESYWEINSNKKLIQAIFPDHPNIFDQVILASYNSGPYRVKKEITRLGRYWRDSRYLKEANKYVKKVTSYCYHFSNSRVSYAPFTTSRL